MRQFAVISLLALGFASQAGAQSFLDGLREKKAGEGTVTVTETGKTYPCDRLGEQAMKILSAGGIKPLMRARLRKTSAF